MHDPIPPAPPVTSTISLAQHRLALLSCFEVLFNGLLLTFSMVGAGSQLFHLVLCGGSVWEQRFRIDELFQLWKQ